MRRILLVEREARTASLLHRSLSERGTVLETTGDPSQAVELVEAGVYDLVLLVLPLEGCNGVDLLRKLIAAREDQQVVVLSPLPDVDLRVRCLDLGATDFVALPCSLPEVLARIRRRLGGTNGDRVLRAGAVTLDLERRAAEVGAESIPLTGREFHLLRHLMTQKDEVCTRVELLAEVWGYSFDPGTNVVDQCVRRLRAKLGDDLIETVRNVGYSLQA
jgi:DNA-binding response OmpR family regulator